MSYIGFTLGGLIPIIFISLLLYSFVFKKLDLGTRCLWSVILAYVAASLFYAYNSLSWGIGFGQGFVSGLIDYSLAAALCYGGYYWQMKSNEKNKAESRV